MLRPWLDTDTRVVGVNFGYTETLDQNYAVERDEAIAVTNQLRTGIDVDSLGVNGVAVDGELNGNPVVGIWVRSVKSGSPADNARIQAGDIVLEIESKVLNDGTLGGYCEVVRSHKMTDTLNVTVLRADTLEVFQGQFNGRELEFASSLKSNPSNSSGSTKKARRHLLQATFILLRSLMMRRPCILLPFPKPKILKLLLKIAYCISR